MHRPPVYARTLFVASCLAVAGCGGGDPVDEKGREVAEWVISQRGTVVVYGSELKKSRRDQLPDGDLAIRDIDLAGRGIRDRDLEKLADLEHLRTLTLHQSKLTDKGMEQLARLESLESLELSYTLVTDAGITKLAPLRNLKKLYVRGTAVTEPGAEALENQIGGLVVER